ncbi:uncharacterized protein LOC134441981 [Engraulis encrasicolus]|uniref:uncharacterized protein LOC134441981 n=1 Tax=Engraulis encrasicolus TaxID=184585 RepID=UPI002FCF72DF
MFTEMIHSVERRSSEVTELIRAQEKAELSLAEGLLKRLEQEIAELKRTDAEMKQHSLTQDPIHFLKNMVSIAGYQYSAVTRRTFSLSQFLEPLKESVSAMKMQLEEKLNSLFGQEIVKISATDTDPDVPVKRADSKEPPDSKEPLPPPHNPDPELPVRREDSYDDLPPHNTDPELPVKRVNSKEWLPPDLAAEASSPATVLMSPQPEVLLLPQLPTPVPSQPKRTPKKIRIRDPNQGGRDITDQLMSLSVYSQLPTDFYIKEHVQKLPAFIRDTTDFINKIADLPNLADDVILVTFDIASLYTNIPHDGGLELPPDPTKEGPAKKSILQAEKNM